ncbi:hypothetical protein DACRYDRAFT_52685 [Dacryopinax primogenitus]|uniref:DNA-directed RNA polymerase III subunit RPC6 n=1 Tax=Dacryopinax primogenitus (strain DJM 731) TaxID=1858805 RepID=M5FUA6_DACPD|nr:uncharacterized protein DACRYDRAFT_52685 [Dacryopinax primogenitus]EJU01296.1 hypothetical protein DACRYDRAFT_52685 [Dacryopinax primogenitus]
MPPKSDPSGTDTLSSVEQVLYKAVVDADVLYQREVEASCPGYPVIELQQAINALLRKSLLKMMKDSKGKPCFKAVNAKDARLLGALQGDESMVYTHIRNSGTEGIWTKSLKAKTNLHATVINRCLKQLEQRQLVKSVKNVKFPTRKTYMLFNLKPSVELTGGPWFNDNELDVGFIEGLLQAVYTFIEKKVNTQTFVGDDYQVWPTSRTDKYPTLADVRRFVHGSGLTEVKLEDEHVKSLLDVLVYDGKIESLPGSGGKGWEEKESDEDRERERSREKRKKRKRAASESDEESEDDRARRKKRSKRRSRSDDEDEKDEKHDSDDEHSHHRSGNMKRKRSSRSDESESEEDDDGSDQPRSRKKRRASLSPTRSLSPVTFRDASPLSLSFSGSVFRAVRRETYGSGLSEIPCGLCEVFDFCAPKGPVNARDCQYYDDWLMPDKIETRGKGKGLARQEMVQEGGEVEVAEEGEEGTWDESGYAEEAYDGDGGGMEIGYEEETFEEYD